jgi:hypothetical protein
VTDGRATPYHAAIVPLSLAEANALVARWHRHSNPTVGHKFSLGLAVGEEVVGAAIVGRPVARPLDDGWTLEVLRCVTDGHRNGCSMLYGACWRAARSLGYRKLVTYTLKSESGSSLRASGWRTVGEVSARSWDTPSRPRVDKHSLQERIRWELAV